jgi:hypothetical protein
MTLPTLTLDDYFQHVEERDIGWFEEVGVDVLLHFEEHSPVSLLNNPSISNKYVECMNFIVEHTRVFRNTPPGDNFFEIVLHILKGGDVDMMLIVLEWLNILGQRDSSQIARLFSLRTFSYMFRGEDPRLVSSTLKIVLLIMRSDEHHRDTRFLLYLIREGGLLDTGDRVISRQIVEIARVVLSGDVLVESHIMESLCRRLSDEPTPIILTTFPVLIIKNRRPHYGVIFSTLTPPVFHRLICREYVEGYEGTLELRMLQLLEIALNIEHAKCYPFGDKAMLELRLTSQEALVRYPYNLQLLLRLYRKSTNLQMCYLEEEEEEEFLLYLVRAQK